MRLLDKLKNRIRTRNDRKFLKKKKRKSFLLRILDVKKSTKPTFWQLLKRKCKTCVHCKYLTHYCFICHESDEKRRHYSKLKYVCCSNYEPKKSRAL